MRFWVGGYGPDGGGEAEGIGALTAGGPHDVLAGGPLGYRGVVAPSASPSWVTRHPSLDVVYATLEERGQVQAFRRTGEESFVRLGEPVDTGGATCHVAVAPGGGWLVASSWNDGHVVRIATDAEGRPSAPVVAAAASDPYAPADGAPASPVAAASASGVDLSAAARALREAAGDEYAHLVPFADGPETSAVEDGVDETDADARVSRAHQAVFLPGGLVATTDMGFDLVRLWRPAGTRLTAVQQVVLPRGVGPRHMAWHPSGHLFVVAELSCELFWLAPDASGTWRLLGGTALGAGTLPGDTAAELALSHDRGFLYAGVRGSNTLATLRVSGDGGSAVPVALVDAQVDWPRHHLVVRDTLLVGGQRSDEVVSLTLDTRTGVPGRVRHRTPVPAPTCLVTAD